MDGLRRQLATKRNSDCLLTATTDSFLPGTLVMLHSFLKHHPNFDGDIVVIEDGLSDASREILAASFRQLRFEPVSSAMRERVARLCALRPELSARKASFHFLEAFRLGGYRKLLYCDGDLLFRASIGELLGSTEALLCCADRFSLRGQHRDAVTYLPVDAGAGGNSAAAGPTLAETFNCGFLVIDERLRRKAVYADLLRMLSPETWRGVKAVSTDQLVLNRYFAGRQTLVSSTYNYLVPCAADIRAGQGIDLEGAKVLHFKLPIKPWSPRAMLHWARPNPAYAVAPGFKLWYDAYVQCLADMHLRRRLRLGASPTPHAAKAPERQGGAPAREGASPIPTAALRSGPPGENPRLARTCLVTATSDDFVPGTLANQLLTWLAQFQLSNCFHFHHLMHTTTWKQKHTHLGSVWGSSFSSPLSFPHSHFLHEQERGQYKNGFCTAFHFHMSHCNLSILSTQSIHHPLHTQK